MPRKKDSKKVKHHNQKQKVSQRVHVEVHTSKPHRRKHTKKTESEKTQGGGMMMYPFGGSTLSVVNNIPEGSSAYQLQQMAGYVNMIKSLQDEISVLKLTNPKVDPTQIHEAASSIKNSIDEVVQPSVRLELAKPMEQNPLFNSPPESESKSSLGNFFTPYNIGRPQDDDTSPSSVSFGVQTITDNSPVLLYRPSSMQQITQQTQIQMPPLRNNSMSIFQTASYLPSKLDEMNISMRNLEQQEGRDNFNKKLKQVGNTYASTYNDQQILDYLARDARGPVGYYPQLHQTMQQKIDQRNTEAFGSTGRFID